ncbi:MAG: aminopeptidase P family protein [Candidatus Aenigmarchaeota archaeon]|nr:aminopeptidase P family protein [Candidatus Aenigmarchaeota archaeon]
MRLISRKKVEAILGRLRQLEVDAAIFINSEPLIDTNIQYLSGFGGMLDGILVLTADGTHLLTTQLDYDRAQEESSVDVVSRMSPREKASRTIKPIVARSRKIGVIKNRFTIAHLAKLGIPASKLVDIDGIMRDERAIKEDKEIEALTKSARISNRGVRFLRGFLKKGVRENEVSAELDRELRTRGSERTPFDIIVTSGSRSFKVHSCPASTSKRIGRGLGLVDFGSVYRGYVTDVTVPFLAGRASAREEMLARTAVSVFGEVSGMIKPGASIDSVAKRYESLIKSNGFEVKHSLGHGIGLDTHDSPSLARGKGKLAAGMTLAIEPGVYKRGIGGCRLENDFLVTGSGACAMTKSKLIRI